MQYIIVDSSGRSSTVAEVEVVSTVVIRSSSHRLRSRIYVAYQHRERIRTNEEIAK
jgi:hypothetical protein